MSSMKYRFYEWVVTVKAFLLGLWDGWQSRKGPFSIGRTWNNVEANEAYDRAVTLVRRDQ